MPFYGDSGGGSGGSGGGGGGGSGGCGDSPVFASKSISKTSRPFSALISVMAWSQISWENRPAA